jgi:nicotinamidase-related amidase
MGNARQGTNQMKVPCILAIAALFIAAPLHAEPAASGISLNLRTRVQPFKGSDEWAEATLAKEIEPKKTAVIICDMWDNHWCQNAAKRCGEMAKKMDGVVKAARDKGILIIHAPSECMDFYKDSPARKRLQEVKKIPLPKGADLPDPPCPVDASSGGCDDNPTPKFFKAWSRQHAAISIDEARDGISDKGDEIYSYLKGHGIDTILVMGVHTNMCILHRSFAIKPMTRLGMHCILVRDLTDAMYDPKQKPFVSHEEGTQRIIQFIEQSWCPTCLSADLAR